MDTRTGSTCDLPPYRAFLVVDMKNFSGERGREHAAITESIPTLLQCAFRRARLVDMWDEVMFDGSTGDGYFLCFNSRRLPHLLNPFLPALQEELAEHNGQSSTPMRMRVSINVGPMTSGETNPLSAGSGDTRVETHRLLDSAPVRDLLERSTPRTCVAAIVSARAYEDAVLGGYTDEDPGLYVPAPVQVKTYQGTAYLRVPLASGGLLTEGFLRPDEKSAEAPVRPEPESGGISQVSGQVAQDSARIGSVQGGVSGEGNVVVAGDQHTSGTRFSSVYAKDRSVGYGGDHHGDITHR